MPERTKAQRHNVYQGAKAQIRRREIRECSMWRDNKIKPRQVQELRYGLEALSVSRQPNFTRIAWQRNEKKHTGRGEADTAHNTWLASHRGGIHQYRESPIQICTACKVRQKQVQIFVEGDMGCSKLLECSAAKASLAAGLAHRPSCPHENRRENE